MAVLLALGASALPAGAAPAPPGAGAGAAPACHTDLPRVRHLVLFEPGTGQDAAAAEIGAACGTLVGYYPEIAVAVATSTDHEFDDRVGRFRAYSAQAEGVTPQPRRPVAPRPRGIGVQSLSLVPPAARAASARPGEVDDRTGEQWDMTMIGADRAHAVRRGSADVLVGVLDSEVDGDHPELSAALDRSASASCVTGVPEPGPQALGTADEHGTHVAGIIAAADDGVGITGVAPGVRIAAVTVVDTQGYIYPEYAVCGFMWAARRHMRIANHSYFVDPWLFACPDMPGQAVVHEALRRAAEHAAARGVLSVAAAGNEALDLAAPGVDTRSPSNARHPLRRTVDQRCDVLPAELPGVLTVSAVGAAGLKSSYSSYGAGVVDLAAPGGDLRQRSPAAGSGCVLSTVPGGYDRMCGTSMAAPHVAGVAALAASAHPDAGPAELAALVLSTARPLACPQGGYDPDSDGRMNARCTPAKVTPDAGGAGGLQASLGTNFYGAGLVDAAAAAH
jgi:subtilisin family serine protease